MNNNHLNRESARSAFAPQQISAHIRNLIKSGKHKEFLKAVKILEEGELIYTTQDPILLFQAAQVARYFRQLDYVERFLERVLAIKPNDARALQMFGDIKFGESKYEEALRFYKLSLNAEISSERDTNPKILSDKIYQTESAIKARSGNINSTAPANQKN
ncbi:MAG: hypothetical protein L6Q57_03870 [Alphaproteobacteria bacterium]|nr:hypothetical protein [Alphaproteobacteria bacterium]